MADKCECDGCGKVYSSPEKLEKQFPDIPDLGQRVAPGERVPAGECNECGAVVHLIPEKGKGWGKAYKRALTGAEYLSDRLAESTVGGVSAKVLEMVANTLDMLNALIEADKRRQP